jgi:hypothetical protein
VLALCAGACIINRPYADLSPASASIRAGGTQAYTAVAISGDETSATTFNISPNGTGTGASCTANVCTATEAGNYLVSGTDGSIVGDTVNLTVDTDPGAPTVGTATAGNAEASVTFSPPSDNGGICDPELHGDCGRLHQLSQRGPVPDRIRQSHSRDRIDQRRQLHLHRHCDEQCRHRAFFGKLHAVTPLAPPTITSFSPASGPPGTVVTISGTNLAGATSVTFKGKPTAITKDTATKLKVKVPVGAKTGKIVVVTAGGSATTATKFKVT